MKLLAILTLLTSTSVLAVNPSSLYCDAMGEKGQIRIMATNYNPSTNTLQGQIQIERMGEINQADVIEVGQNNELARTPSQIIKLTNSNKKDVLVIDRKLSLIHI